MAASISQSKTSKLSSQVNERDYIWTIPETSWVRVFLMHIAPAIPDSEQRRRIFFKAMQSLYTTGTFVRFGSGSDVNAPIGDRLQGQGLQRNLHWSESGEGPSHARLWTVTVRSL